MEWFIVVPIYLTIGSFLWRSLVGRVSDKYYQRHKDGDHSNKRSSMYPNVYSGCDCIEDRNALTGVVSLLAAIWPLSLPFLLVYALSFPTGIVGPQERADRQQEELENRRQRLDRELKELLAESKRLVDDA